MKLLILVAFVASAFAVPALEMFEDTERYYDPEEENPYRIRYIYQEAENGSLQLVDLFEVDEAAPRATINDVTFHLFTQRNPNQAQIVPGNNFNALANTNFNPSLPIKFIIHGWNNNAGSQVNSAIRPAILNNNNVNVFVVDWSRPANQMYTTARSAVPVVGGFVGDFINRIRSTHNVPLNRIQLVGHSLGAHVAGCAGARVNGLVHSIVGLDPAGPLFTVGNIDNRIDPTDAAFVQIIHTNHGLLGFGTSSGHADYRPNGGRSQPGCGIDLAGSCAHSRAHAFFAESVRTGRFISWRCDSMNDLNNNRCTGNHRSFMGQFEVDRTARGDYFLATNNNAPFARG
ncbi:phospholipase A1 VesT1.02-like [Onthophagus taurus]|uniref:phospholipase A1 VesT1.02-like n=1 Tax=Onthophagus taurus TaxID=166361 RepID=UPI0039BE2798